MNTDNHITYHYKEKEVKPYSSTSYFGKRVLLSYSLQSSCVLRM